MAGHGNLTEEHRIHLSESVKEWWRLNKGIVRKNSKLFKEGHKPANKGIKTGVYKKCLECDGKIYLQPNKQAQARKFCSNKCFLVNLRREGSHLKKASCEHKSTSVIKQRLLEKQEKCELCGFEDKRILQLHHKDMDHNNNNDENLIMICPNCHAILHYEAGNGMYHKLKKRKQL